METKIKQIMKDLIDYRILNAVRYVHQNVEYMGLAFDSDALEVPEEFSYEEFLSEVIYKSGGTMSNICRGDTCIWNDFHTNDLIEESDIVGMLILVIDIKV